MIYNKLIEILKRIMPQVDTSQITFDSILTTDLGVDSLNMMLLAISVEEEFEIEFESNARIATVGDICEYVERRKCA